MRAFNVALARELSRVQDGKRHVEAEMRCRRKRYCRLFGGHLKTTPANRKGAAFIVAIALLVVFGL